MPILTHRAQGAQVLNARLEGGLELFYCSPLTSQFPGPARGGMPVLFPQFAEAGPLPKHGFARERDWTLLEQGADMDEEHVKYVLDIAPADVDYWPFAARLELDVTAQAQGVDFALSVLNTGADAFSFTGGLHPYFLLDDLLSAQVEGLRGLAAADRYRPDFSRQEAPLLQFTDEIFERLYDGCPALVLSNRGRRISLRATGFDQWMVWNPGREGAKGLKDLPDDDWRHFVCIEPVRVTRPVTLQSGEKFEGTFSVALD
ncbi:aldose epimerase family protein [Azohydromonas aeria]|uniref:aldose epimerase family protein n=1 Tax=Azohydromonas aeria TaxID=2590212 RepID=UPI0012F8C25A|nr:D-hexose-6-phosphate mutarotase [Azohydromonas aeria]